MTTTTALTVTPEGPFDLDAARGAFCRWSPASRHVPDGGDGSAPGDALRVGFVLDGDHTPVAAALRQREPDGVVEVEIAGTDRADRTDAALRQVARMLSLDHDASGLAAVAERDPAVGAVLARVPGLRPTLFPSPYEAAAWAVISPRIGMRQAAALQARLAAAHGETLTVGGAPVTAFPTPAALSGIAELPGLPGEKVRRLHEVARAAQDGLLDVDHLRELGPDGARAALRRIRGIGPFWASGIWLRACGVVDEWPDEPRATATLARLHDRDAGDPADPAAVADLTAVLAPYRMWVAFLLRMAG